ncbi:hypothetical protein [Streptomyces sp. V4I8]|uniref:hypothetical protein n=1 Tax=Streptomyces sp. V4I8 TaxID=3156469 RepID=UPI003511A06B
MARPVHQDNDCAAITPQHPQCPVAFGTHYPCVFIAGARPTHRDDHDFTVRTSHYTDSAAPRAAQ